MGALADAALEARGHVTGVIPRQLVSREVAHERLTELHVVESMHERKALMAERADAFVALPGGLGTLEETFEVLTWSQLGLHQKGTVLFDVAGYFDLLASFLDHAVREGFVLARDRDLIVVERDVPAVLERLETFRPSAPERWLESAEET